MTLREEIAALRIVVVLHAVLSVWIVINGEAPPFTAVWVALIMLALYTGYRVYVIGDMPEPDEIIERELEDNNQ